MQASPNRLIYVKWTLGGFGHIAVDRLEYTMNAATITTAPVSEDLLTRYDISGPRYTSYPTADRFVEAFAADDYAQALTQRRSGAAALAVIRIDL